MKLLSCGPTYTLLVIGCCTVSGQMSMPAAYAADVTVAVVPVAVPSPADELVTLPTPMDSVAPGSTFYAEIWAQTTYPDGLSMVSTDVAFNAARLQALSVIHSDLMDLFPSGSVDNINGRINDLSGSHHPVIPACSDVIGVDSWARVALIQFRADTPGLTTIDLSSAGSMIYVVSLCGLLTGPTVDYLDASITVLVSEIADVVLVAVASPSPSDTLAVLPVSIGQVELGDVFYTECWARTTFANGFSMVSADVTFDPARLEVVSVTHSALMGLFPSGVIDNVNGRVDNLSGSHSPVIPACSDQVGATGWARLGWIGMRADAVGAASINLSSTGSAVFVVALCGLLNEPITNYAGVSVTIYINLPPTVGDNTCQDTAIPCSTDADCPVGVVCGMKSRYVTVKPSNNTVAGDSPTSIQVEILSMPQFPDREGEIWFAGPEQDLPDPPNPNLRGALLECTTTPHAQTWTAGNLHLFGPLVVPGSLYGVRMCDENGENCSDSLTVATGKWGDVVRPFGGMAQPNFSDIASIVDKFRFLEMSPSIPRSDLTGLGGPGFPNTPNQVANFADVASDVEAFRGFVFPYAVPMCP